MHESFNIFMKEIIDYAGLFPPAGLPLDQALGNYSRYRKGPYRWMLSRFIIPVGKLPELDSYRETLLAEGEPYRFSLLGAKTKSISQFMDELDNVVSHAEEFHKTHGPDVTTEVLEIKLPSGEQVAGDPELLSELLTGTAEKMNGSDRLPGMVFLETPMGSAWREELDTVLPTIGRFNRQHDHPIVGFKLRCGGTEAAHFPTPEQVAVAINRARDNDLLLKCTAGLHHPVRFYSGEVEAKMHGFLNVFGGGMLSHLHRFDDRLLVDILSDEEAGNFNFSANSFRWKDYELHLRDIAKLRDTSMLSFGSCSFEEPVEDLKALELLD
ncbi:MAG: hypothetical protein R3211_08610 [Balneolaceae bacterium]|nr:hypothetical protein [Balneolaceae bacterium]